MKYLIDFSENQIGQCYEKIKKKKDSQHGFLEYNTKIKHFFIWKKKKMIIFTYENKKKDMDKTICQNCNDTSIIEVQFLDMKGHGPSRTVSFVFKNSFEQILLDISNEFKVSLRDMAFYDEKEFVTLQKIVTAKKSQGNTNIKAIMFDRTFGCNNLPTKSDQWLKNCHSNDEFLQVQQKQCNLHGNDCQSTFENYLLHEIQRSLPSVLLEEVIKHSTIKVQEDFQLRTTMGKLPYYLRYTPETEDRITDIFIRSGSSVKNIIEAINRVWGGLPMEYYWFDGKVFNWSELTQEKLNDFIIENEQIPLVVSDHANGQSISDYRAAEKKREIW